MASQDWALTVPCTLLLCWPIVNHFTLSLLASQNTAMSEAIQISRVVLHTHSHTHRHSNLYTRWLTHLHRVCSLQRHSLAKTGDSELCVFREGPSWKRVVEESRSPDGVKRKKKSEGRKREWRGRLSYSDERKRCLLLVIVCHYNRSKRQDDELHQSKLIWNTEFCITSHLWPCGLWSLLLPFCFTTQGGFYKWSHLKQTVQKKQSQEERGTDSHKLWLIWVFQYMLYPVSLWSWSLSTNSFISKHTSNEKSCSLCIFVV